MFKKYFLLALVFVSCSSAPEIIEKPVPVLVPGITDTIYLKDTVTIEQDTVYYGDVTDSLNNVIGWLKFFYNKKIAELKLKPRIDTVIIKDTIKAAPKTNVIQEISGLLPFWAEAILMAFAVGLLALVNKGTLKNILKVFK